MQRIHLFTARFKQGIALGLFCLLAASGLQAQKILFVGNSFTFVPKTFKGGLVHDLNSSNYGGIPAILHTMATNSGAEGFDIHMETVGGKTLAWHIQNKMHLIDQAWDVVILQDYSTRALKEAPGDRASFRAAVDTLTTALREKNEAVEIILYETWARPDRILAGLFPNIEAMQAEIQEGYSQAAIDYKTDIARVGEAFLAAVQSGLADDPSTEVKEGAHSLWGNDKYHQGHYGAYLSAAIFYAKIFGLDPRTLSTGEGSVAAELELDPTLAKSLLEIAYDTAKD